MKNQFLVLCLVASLGPTLIRSGYPSSGYGYNKYPYLPAPPGQTPACAKYGATFCEKVETYPQEAIQYLLFKWGYTYSQFIKSERNEDFMLMIQNETYYPKFPTYGPYYGSPSNHYDDYSSQQVVHNNSATSYNINSQHNPQPQAQPSSPNYHFQPQQQQQQQQYFNNGPTFMDPHAAAAVIIPPIIHSIWWSHRDKTNRPAFPYLPQNRFHRIQKRQVTTDENQVCPVRSMFTIPQAAMNNDGNWMYVVNMGGTRYSQQVRTEVCSGGDRGPCNGLCQVPPGYTATCRQKYVQKRLIALDGSGASLRGEVFWFPHCCVCEVVPTSS